MDEDRDGDIFKIVGSLICLCSESSEVRCQSGVLKIRVAVELKTIGIRK